MANKFKAVITIIGTNYNSKAREERTEIHDAEIEFCKTESDYGNGYCMGIVSDLEPWGEQGYDIRYSDYCVGNEIEFITKFYANKYNGKNGAWKLIGINLQKEN